MLSNRVSRPHPMVDTSLPMKERAARTPCTVRCSLIVNGTPVNVVMVDFSDMGFQVSSDHMLQLGSPVALALPRCAPVEASVRWSLGSRAGCRFYQPLAPEAISAAVAAAAAK